MFWMRDWYSGLEKLGFKKLSYAKERHFHGLSVVKIKEDPISDDLLKEISEKFYILQDKHDLSHIEIQNES